MYFFATTSESIETIQGLKKEDFKRKFEKEDIKKDFNRKLERQFSGLS